MASMECHSQNVQTLLGGYVNASVFEVVVFFQNLNINSHFMYGFPFIYFFLTNEKILASNLLIGFELIVSIFVL